MGRSPCCDKSKVKRGPWSPEEDSILRNHIQNHGTGGNWIALPNKAGLKRCGKSCRLRWLNYLRPDIKLGGFTKEEDEIISSLYLNIGSRWSVIASHLHGRTDNDVKNHWNTKLKKKLLPSHNTTTTTTTSASSTSSMEFRSPFLLPKQETEDYQVIHDHSMLDYSILINYDQQQQQQQQQQQLIVSNSNISNFNDNMSSSLENQGFSTNAIPMGNDYASWCDNDRATDFANDLLTMEFDFRQVLGEVANFNYSSQWL